MTFYLSPTGTQHITLNVKDGDPVNITCRASMEASPSVVWFKDKVSIYTGRSKFLFLANVNRSQAGNYVCVSTSPSGNTSSPVTTVNVLCEYFLFLHVLNKSENLRPFFK